MSVLTATIESEGALVNPGYELVSLDITKEANRIPTAQLVYLDGNAAKGGFPISETDTFKPGAMVVVKLHYEGESGDLGKPAQVFAGVVVKQGVEMSAGASTLTVALKDAAVKLTLARKNAVHRDQTDDQIMKRILEDNGFKDSTIPQAKPKHVELVQSNCTDWDFILMRADALGWLTLADDGRISLHQVDLSASPKHSFDCAVRPIFNFEIELDAGRQPVGVNTMAWDLESQELTPPVAAAAFALKQGNLKGEALAEAIGFGTTALTHTAPLPQPELQAWADARLLRSRLAMIRGRLSTPGFADIKPMDAMEIVGVGKRFNGTTLVTGVRHRIGAHGWHTDIQFGISPKRFAQSPDLMDAPAGGLLPAVNGLRLGKAAAFLEDPDKQLRVKVELPGLDPDDNAVWARLAAPDAGANRGFFFRPEQGDEVVVGFIEDDPRQAVVLGSLYSAKNPPHKDLGTPDEKNAQKAIVTMKGSALRFVDEDNPSILVQTPAANKVVLDDNEQTVTIADQHGNRILMDKNGIAIASAKDLKIEGKNIAITGSVKVRGDLDVS